MQLANRVVLIAGGRRVGSRLAPLLAERGAAVVMSWFQSRERIETTISQIIERGGRGLAVQADLRQPSDAERFVGAAIETFGRVDVLVNMTSEFHPTPFETLTPEQFDENIAVNLKAPFLTAVAAARAMRRNSPDGGVQGKIINFCDWAVDRPYLGFLPYFAAKGGLVALTRALASELAPTIAVNAISPALIDAPPNLTADDLEAIRLASPLERLGTPADANNLVMYLLEGTDFVTGEVYRVDGGRFLGRP